MIVTGDTPSDTPAALTRQRHGTSIQTVSETEANGGTIGPPDSSPRRAFSQGREASHDGRIFLRPDFRRRRHRITTIAVGTASCLPRVFVRLRADPRHESAHSSDCTE